MAKKKRGDDDEAKPKGSNSTLLLILGGVGVLALCVCCGGAGVGGFVFFKPKGDGPPPIDKIAADKPPIDKKPATKNEPKPPITISTNLSIGPESLAISADAKFAIVGGAGARNVEIWNLAEQRRLFDASTQPTTRQAIAISADGKLAAFGSDRFPVQISIVDVASGQVLRKLAKKNGALDPSIVGLQFSPKGDTVLAGSIGEILRWTVAGQVRPGIKVNDRVMALSPIYDGGRKIAIAELGRRISIRDPFIVGGGGELTLEQKTLWDPPSEVTVAVTPDGKTIAAVTAPRQKIEVWHPPEKQPRREFTHDMDMMSGFTITPDGKTLIYGTKKFTIAFVDIETGARTAEWPGHKQSVTGLCVSADQTTLVSASFDRTIKIWELKK